MAQLPFKLVSADSHIVEPPTLWTDRMDAKYRDRAPRIELSANGHHEFFCEGTAIPQKGIGLMATAKKYTDPDDLYFSMDGSWADVPRGGYDPYARLSELDEEGIEAELLYTSLGLVMYTIPDVEFQYAAFRAFNDWLAEYCSAAPARLFGVAMIPPDSPERAVAELERCARLGLRGAMISIDDAERGYNHPDFDPLWRAAAEHNLPISLHVAASTESFRRTDNAFTDFSLGFTPTMYTITNMIFEGLFDRHPKLKVISVENDAAWPLSMLERMDDRFLRDQGWAGESKGLSSGKVPSEVFREHIACSFMRDRTAIVNRDIIGPRNIMWGSDYPHFDGGWPDAAGRLAAQFGGVPIEDQVRIGRTNCIEFYDLPLETDLAQVFGGAQVAAAE